MPGGCGKRAVVRDPSRGIGMGKRRRSCQRPLIGVSRGVGDRNVGNCPPGETDNLRKAGQGEADVPPREGAGIHSGGESSQRVSCGEYICGEPGQASTAEGGTRGG